MRCLPPLASCTLLLLLAGGGVVLPSARGDEPDRSAWLVGREYEKGEPLVVAGRTVEVWTAKVADEDVADEPAWFRFLLLGDEGVREAWHVDVARPEDRWVFDLRQEDEGPEAPGVRVGLATAGDDDDWIAALSPRLEAAVGALDGWRAAAARLAAASAIESPSERRPLALDAYRALERLARAFPDHRGVRRDLLVAAQLLAPLESGSDRGANLAFLWRENVSALSARADEAEIREIRRTVAVCSLAEGCVAATALVLQGTPEGEDEGLDALRPLLAANGQDRQEEIRSLELTGRGSTLHVGVLRCDGEPAEHGLPFHRLTVLLGMPDRVGGPAPAWWSLSCERTGERSRWALHGWVGGSRRLIRLYGAEEPDGEVVVEHVLALLGAAVGGEEPK